MQDRCKFYPTIDLHNLRKLKECSCWNCGNSFNSTGIYCGRESFSSRQSTTLPSSGLHFGILLRNLWNCTWIFQVKLNSCIEYLSLKWIYMVNWYVFCFRLGMLVDFLSRSTIIGFMGGTAIIIILQQLKGILGLKHLSANTDVISVLHSVFTQTNQVYIFFTSNFQNKYSLI